MKVSTSTATDRRTTDATEEKKGSSRASNKKAAKASGKKGEEEGTTDTRVEISSKKVSEDPRISPKNLAEAEKLMAQVNSGTLSEADQASALKRVGQILGRQGNA